LLYRILKVWVKAGYTFYFGKIEVEGLENVDPNKAAIFAVNHPSAFIEPTLIAVQSPFDVHFMTRGDVFIKRFKWFFEGTNQVPVFRFKDGFSSLRNNKSSFDKCHEKLISGAKLLIFCEGSMKWIKRLRPVQQGAAKLAMGTLTKQADLPLVIHPVGVNYEDHSRPGSAIMLQFGPPIQMEEYFQKYQNSNREVILEITQHLQAALQECIVHIEEDKDLKLLDAIWSPMLSLETPKDSKYSGELFSRYKNASNWINGLNSGEKQNFRTQVSNYTKKLKSLHLNDRELHAFQKLNWFDFLWILSLGSILKIVFELNKLPFRLADYISKKKTPNIEFYVSVKAVLTTMLYSFFIIVLLIFWSPVWQPVLFVLLGWLGSKTNQKWMALVKGIQRNQKKADEAYEARNQLVDFLKTKINYE